MPHLIVDDVQEDQPVKNPHIETLTPFGVFKPLSDRLQILTNQEDENKEDQLDK